MNRWVTLGLLLAISVGLFLRWPAPDQRPFHNDEAVNGVKFARLWQNGAYKYDPNEHHGPSLYYFSYLFGKLTGAPAQASQISDEHLRWLPVVFGLGLIPLLVLLKDGLGRFGVLWAGILTAASTSFVFYSVYYIHEMLLVFFSAAVLCCAWRYWRSRKVAWAIACGISFGLMAATKETFVLSAAAGVIAVLLNHLWNRFLDATGLPTRAPALDLRHLALATATGLFTAVLFFTSFFTNANGIIDAVRTYQPWLARAGGESPHLHPWHFFAERLLFYKIPGGPLWSEGLILVLACFGAYAAFARKATGDARASLLRFLAFYSVCLAGMYSAIMYKTPWCLLGFWHGFILLAGVGAAWLIRNCPKGWPQVAALIGLLGLTLQLGWQAYNSLNKYGADRKNPYVYAQTSADLRRLTEKVSELIRHGQGSDTLIKVVATESDYWPLPWYLLGYKNVGWWDALPADHYAPLMIVSAKMDARLDEKGTHLMAGYFELRPSVFLELYVELELWKRFLGER